MCQRRGGVFYLVLYVCVFPVWVPLRPPVGRFVEPSVWWSAFVRPLCVGRANAVCWPLSVLHSVCDIHSLHVVHRLRCGALAHFTRYCRYQNGVMYEIRKESRGGGRILRKRRAIVLQ